MKEFIKHDDCERCQGKGYRIEKTYLAPFGERFTEYEQCENCEEMNKEKLKRNAYVE